MIDEKEIYCNKEGYWPLSVHPGNTPDIVERINKSHEKREKIKLAGGCNIFGDHHYVNVDYQGFQCSLCGHWMQI